MNGYKERISVDPEICHGQACVKGTRIPVYVILDALASGMTQDEIAQDYPPVTSQDIKACILYASAVTRDEETPIGA